MRILLTGSTGCVGQYLTELLLAETSHKLVLVVRDSRKLNDSVRDNERVEIVETDLCAPNFFHGFARKIDCAILLATAWGGARTFETNVDSNLRLAQGLVDGGCKRIIYFSTASVLKPDSSLLKEAGEYGTDYIRSKYELVKGMESLGHDISILGMFPTLVVGGKREHPQKPLSHFANLMLTLRKYLWLIRFFSAHAGFHMIHAKDIASIVVSALAQEKRGNPERWVLGMAPTEINDLVKEFCKLEKRRYWGSVTLGPRFVRFFRLILPVKLSRWDEYCLDHPVQIYKDAISPQDFGKQPSMVSISDCWNEIKD